MNTNNSSTSSFDFESMKKTMAELSAKMRSMPTAFVMTTATLQAVKDRIGKDDRARDSDTIGFGFLSFAGVAVEDFPTVRECLDRMLNQQPGERLQLVLDGLIPDDCVSHPWLAKQAKAISETCQREANDRIRRTVFDSEGFRWRVRY